MKIAGLQKLSLVDFDGHISATIFTSGCNFACPFCHNSRLVKDVEDDIKITEILEFLTKRKNMLDSVCISGGEPTLHPDLPDFIKKIKDLGYIIKLDTNGTNPDMIKQLYENNLIDYIAMDIKNSYEKYPFTAGKNINLDNIKKSIKYIMNCGIDYEFRTTIMQGHHTMQDIKDIGKMIKGAKKHFLQKFEDSGECLTKGLQAIEKADAIEFKNVLSQYVQQTNLRGY